MSSKLQRRVNGGLAIYFGIGSLFATVICFVVLLVMAYQSIFQQSNFTWGIFLLFAFFLICSAGMAYALLRVGYEEIED